MIIGIDASRANHEQKTGVEWYAYFVIEEMKKLTINSNTHVVLYSDEPLKGDLAKLPAGWSSKVLRWPPKRLWTQLRLSLEMLIHAPDVLFVPAHVPPIIHPKKTVVTIHDIAALRFAHSYNWFERWYSLWTARYAIKHVSSVIVPSNFTKQELQSYTNISTTSHVHVVAHGVDTQYAIPTSVDLESLHIRAPYMLSVGRLEEKKNTKRIIETFNKLRDSSNNVYQLVLVGKPGFGYEHVEAAIQASPYKQDIILSGWIDQKKVVGLMQQASVFLFPSLYEGFGMPLLEAFLAGTPVVAAKGSCLEEVGGDAALYADPLSIDSIYEQLTRVLSDAALAQQLVSKGKERVQNYSWEKTAQETYHHLHN